MKRFALFFLLFVVISNLDAFNEVTEKSKPKSKKRVYLKFLGNRSLTDLNVKYFNLGMGIKNKCKYKIGFEYSWLRGNYESDDFAVNKIDYPNATNTTKSDINLASIAFKPLIYGGKKFNIWMPIHAGQARVSSDYLDNSKFFINYHRSNAPFADISADFDFRFLKILKLSIEMGYRHIESDFKIASDVFSGPMIGVGIKIERFCKR